MEARSGSHWLLLLCGLFCLAASLQVVQGAVESEGPSESECRPFIEKALKELEIGLDSKEDVPTVEVTAEDDDDEHEDETLHETDDDDDQKEETPDGDGVRSGEDAESAEDAAPDGDDAGDSVEAPDDGSEEDQGAEVPPDDRSAESQETPEEEETPSLEEQEDEPRESAEEGESKEETREESAEEEQTTESIEQEQADAPAGESAEEEAEEPKESVEVEETKEESVEEKETEEEAPIEESLEEAQIEQSEEEPSEPEEDIPSLESAEEPTQEETVQEQLESKEEPEPEETEPQQEEAEPQQEEEPESQQEEEPEPQQEEEAEPQHEEVEPQHEEVEPQHEEVELQHEEVEPQQEEAEPQSEEVVPQQEEVEPKLEEAEPQQEEELQKDEPVIQEVEVEISKDEVEAEKGEGGESEEAPEEELILEDEKPDELRPTEHIAQLLKLDDEYEQKERIMSNIAEITLKDLKRLYENAIKPLETLYKYRDLSNRHFGDAEIFAKPLVLFMGPWSGGKSSIINYLVDNEYNETSLRTGAEPSPAYFNIMMHGDEPEVLDGTQLAADFTFSGLQKFGQGLEERLRGMKLPKKLLEKVNIVEIPGILEVRKQVSRMFPFNDACQWFIDRADIIFLVYDPSKLDVGPETEAILDQLKGREHQTRIILNKADQVKPEELMRVQGALIWNISPLMSSAQPPAMYTTSLWSRPYEPWAPVRLLQAQERAFLRDLRTAVDKRIENRIASARRFAVRVRNHAKMVDCYLTTYYNHKSVFGNRKQVADAIIEHPQDYHIYEGLSTLTNISRYDLPDPDVYRDFFRLNPLYEFQQLSATCTYFRGCPINRLDVAIAYDLPELVGKHKKMVEEAVAKATVS